MSDPEWIGIRLHGPVDVMRRLAARLDRALQPNDDHGALPLDQIRTGRVYFWVRPNDAQLDTLAELLVATPPMAIPRPSTRAGGGRPRAGNANDRETAGCESARCTNQVVRSRTR
jgi:hypothetical protein